MLEIIVRNSARCLRCGDEIESEHQHDFRCCSCGNLCVDGGHEYRRRVFETPAAWFDTSTLAEPPASREQISEAFELLALAKAGARPKPELYARAPILDEWKIVDARVPPAAAGMSELEGDVSDHPEFRSGQRIRTTPLLIAGHERGWALTVSGQYWRLGRPGRLDA